MAQQPPPFKEPDYNKPKLFAGLPEKIAVQPQYLETFLTAAVGQTIAIHLGAATVEGFVTSKSDPSDPSLQSVVVRSTNFVGALFTFSKVVEKDGRIFYRARLLSRQHSDAFELVKANGDYQFEKKHQLRILSE
ncbi:MAG TPA: hypothetical protein VGB56_06210 [Flavisolibacter sp.]|jgi:hypothetical protein